MSRMTVVEGRTIKETPDAILADIEGQEIWLPKSQLKDWPDEGDMGEIELPEWLAEDKELI